MCCEPGKKTGQIPLKVECERNGWKVVLLAVEVGARGFVAESFVSGMKKLGFGGRK